MKSYRIAYINRHYRALAELAGKQDSPNFWEIGQSLYRRLRRLECRARNDALLFCTNPMDGGIDSDEMERRHEKVAEAVKKLFNGKLPEGFFINSDPRGHALKINAGNEAGMVYHPEYIPAGLHKDWGGYGILAPEEF